MNYNKLKMELEKFKQFRQADETKYKAHERDYKVELIDFLEPMIKKIIKEPQVGVNSFVSFLKGEAEAKKHIGSLDNLLTGFSGYAQRDDFRIFLENNDINDTADLFSLISKEGITISQRFSTFRNRISDAYQVLYEEGKFSSKKKSKPYFTTTFASVLFMAFDRYSYCLYQSTRYEKMLSYLEVPIPGPIEEKYQVFVESCRNIFQYAKENSYPLDDMIDIHNFIYIWDSGFNDPNGDENDDDIYAYIKNSGFIFSDWMINNYLLCLLTKPFVILTGISGTGKTKIAQLLASYITEKTGNEKQVAFMSVRPDWTDSTYLLGYYNPITEKYEVTPFLSLMLKAVQDPQKPYFVILDEMNIAKVEHYFSDFLSCLESRRLSPDGKLLQEPIILHNESRELSYTDQDSREWLIPAKINIPSNIYFTGTVNVDETTYMFSPKVLDRANTIELNEVYLESNMTDLASDFIFKKEANLADLFKQPSKPAQYSNYISFQSDMKKYNDSLVQINTLLAKHKMHFGYRVANEIAVYMQNVKNYCLDNSEAFDLAFDIQVKQKILPKFNGSAAKLNEPLTDLLNILDERFSQSKLKIEHMLQQLERAGFASFIE